MFDRQKYFDAVRKSLFGGSLEQDQVDGQEIILSTWESDMPAGTSVRWLAYMLATTFHETSKEMQPIAEYGHGSSQSYGKTDPETGQAYYGRGFVQLTWRDNYAKADRELQLNPSCEWDADQQLRADVAAPTMFIGMVEGWFRTKDGKPETLARYFDDDTDDAYNARGIINGDKSTVPSWSNGVSIGNLIAGYHSKFLQALQASWIEDAPPVPEPVPPAPTPSIGIALSLALAMKPGEIVSLYDQEENLVGTISIT